MTHREPIDAPAYLRMFPLDTPGTLALIIKLVRVTPRSAAAADVDEMKRIRPAARTLREGGLTLRQTWKIREESGTTKLRPIDIEWDAAWGAMLARLEPWSIFEKVRAHALDAESAAHIRSLIYPNRLDFTRLELNAQWIQGKKRLEWIEEKGLRDDLVRLAGAPFVGRVDETHQKLGRALGMLGDAPDPDLPLVVDLAGAKRAAHDAIVAYALQLIAADATASDPLSDQIRASLAVIDEFRARARPSGGAGEDEAGGDGGGADTDTDDTDVVEPPVDPNTPIPPLPEE